MTVAFYYDGLFNPYKTAPQTFPPHVEQAVEQIHKATKGLGTDEKALIQALTAVNDADRELIIRRYKDVHGKELKDLVKSETSGHFGFLARLLSMPLPEMEAFIVHEACSGAGTNEKLLFPIVIGRTANEMNLLKRTYFEKYNKDLSVVLNSELSGDFKKVIMAAVQAQLIDFNPAFHTGAKAEEDAEKLYKAGQGKWGTDEETFIKILFTSPPQYLEMVNAFYVKKYNNNIRIAVEKEFGGDAERALLYYVGSSLDPFKTFAEHLESTMKGLGTDERGLSVDFVRFRPHLQQVTQEYERQYKKSLKDRIHGETSGDFRALLLALYDAPASAY